MEVLLVASSVLLAAQYKRDPTQLRLPSTNFFKKQGNASEDDPVDVDVDEFGSRQTPMQENEEPTGEKSGVTLGPGEYNFYPDDFFYNTVAKGQTQATPFPSRPSPKFPGPSPLPGVHNPVQVDMMNDIRTGNNRIPASAHIATSFRPSWVRNVVDNDPAPRQERIREWSTETPRDAFDKTLPTVTQRARQHGLATLNDFGKGGLPFDDQIRVVPDGLDPDPLRRQPTARYNTYALGDDLTHSMGDYGKIRGLANGQRIEGPAIRQEGWDLMPDRDIQLQPSTAPIPLSGAGVRGGGRGASLGSFLGAAVPKTIRQGVEWDAGATGNKGVPKHPVRPQDDPLDKRFVYEDIDPTKAQAGASFRPEVPQGPTSLVGDKGAWKFSFDMKSLFDMNLPAHSENRDEVLMSKDDPRTNIHELNANPQILRRALPLDANRNDRPETADEKFITLHDDARSFVKKGTADSKRRVTNVQSKLNDRPEIAEDKPITSHDDARAFVKKGTADSKRRLTNLQPKKTNTAAFGATAFKTETSSTETVVSSGDIGVAKKIATQEAFPTGLNASGRRMAVEKSDAPLRLDAINDVASFNNDHIFERGGTLREPMAAPKADTPDYAQATVNTMRNGREFRRR